MLLIAGCVFAAPKHPKEYVGRPAVELLYDVGYPQGYDDIGCVTTWIYEIQNGWSRFIIDNGLVIYYDIVQKREDGKIIVVEKYKK
jgi:hypothetical protein